MNRNQVLYLKNFKLPSWNVYYAGKHWGLRKSKADEIHNLVCAEVKCQKIHPVKKAALKFDIHLKDRRRRDLDNFAVKFIVDSLVMSGVLKDDSISYVPAYSVFGKMGCEIDEVVVTLSSCA